MRRAGYQSVWSPACQDQVAGGHSWVGVVSLGGAPLSLRSFVAPDFREFFRLGRALRTTLPIGKGGVVHLFVLYGYQGAEEDADQLKLNDKLLQAVLAEAQAVCIGQFFHCWGFERWPCCYSLPLLKVFLLVSLLTWLWRILLELVLNRTLPVSSNGRMVLVLPVW